ncbi:MAG: nucleotidyltransferase family protein [Waterburya sp.]
MGGIFCLIQPPLPPSDMAQMQENIKYPKTKTDVLNTLKENLDKFAQFHVTKVGLFGSFVRDEQTENSDIDILVDLESSDFFNYCALLDFAESLFGERKVDVITKSSLDSISGRNIFREVEFVN